MRAGQAVRFDNISVTTGNFTLYGGDYQIAVVATFGGGNVVLEQLGPDNVTYFAMHSVITANGTTRVQVPPGVYRFRITTATAVFVSAVFIQAYQ